VSTGLIGIIALLTVLGLSLVITRVATVALTMTGLSEEAARFQARSAFTGTGFTTKEAETVMNHPVRRQIIMFLMIIRSAGLVSIIMSLILSFLGSASETTKLYRLAFIVGGVLLLWLFAASKKIERFMGRAIEWALLRWTNLDVRDYASLLRLSDGYNVMEVHVQEGDWVCGKNLRACYLPEEGITVLGIIRDDGTYIGGPKGDTEIFAGDILILYGRMEKLRELDKRRADPAGDVAHARSVNEQKKRMEDQDRIDQEHIRKRQIEQAEYSNDKT
jgi:NhaP-type Na+/H+ and K+/H+ antiporter